MSDLGGISFLDKCYTKIENYDYIKKENLQRTIHWMQLKNHDSGNVILVCLQENTKFRNKLSFKQAFVDLIWFDLIWFSTFSLTNWYKEYTMQKIWYIYKYAIYKVTKCKNNNVRLSENG